MAFNGYIALFINPVNWIPQIVERFKRAKISYERLKNFYELEPEKINEKYTIKEELQGSIEIRNLSFCYSEKTREVLKNINLKIKKGETVGIIGTIGSGKTTLINLLTKLYNVENNKILFDGRDINEVPIEILRNNICYISQDNFLFSSSIKNNISLFKEDYEEYEITESTKKAIIYDDILNMENGIDTVIGEGGGDLSGGQRQRIAISRAFLKNSKILIFDDTFSALDNRTSEKLIENIRELADERTCIIISNKVSDVKYSDKIIVIDDGNIVETGTHEELIQKNGIYNQFYNQQSKKVRSYSLI